MKRFIILIFLTTLPYLVYCQFAESIRTGRPGQGIGAYALGKQVVQIQSGITFNELSIAEATLSSVIETNVIRFGITEKFEISAVIGWRSDNLKVDANEFKTNGIHNTQIGGRYNFLESDGPVPSLGFQGRVLLKAQSKDYQREELGSSFILASGNSLNDWLSWGANLGITWTGNNTDPLSTYVFNLTWSISDRIGGLTEIYGNFDNNKLNYDLGLSYLVNNDFQLDISAGWQGHDEVSDWFIDGGISYRIHWRENGE